MKDCNICISIATNLIQFSGVSFQRNSRQERGEFSCLFLLWHWFGLFHMLNQRAKFSRADEDGAGHTHLGQPPVLWMGVRNSPLPLLKEKTDLLVPPWEFKDSCCSLLAGLTSPETVLSLDPWGMGRMRSMSAIAACCKLCVLALEISSALWPL